MRLTEAAYDEELVEQLVGGELELAFVIRPTDPALEHVPRAHRPVRAARTRRLGARCRRAATVRIRDIARSRSSPTAGPSDGGEAFLLAARARAARSCSARTRAAPCQGLVGAGIGYALVPRSTVDQTDRDVAALEVAGVPPREITLAWHADRTLTTARR